MHGFAQYDVDAIKALILEDPENPNICVLSQQAAEKVLKSKIRDFSGINRKGHDLYELMVFLSRLTGINPSVGLLEDAGFLTDLYITMRYDDVEPVVEIGPESSEEAYEVCTRIIAWVESIRLMPDGTYVVSMSRKSKRRSFFQRFRR